MSLLLYLVFVHVALLLPGYVFLKKNKFVSKNPGLQLCLSYLVTITIFAILAICTYVLRFPPLLTRVVTISLLGGAGIFFLTSHYYKDLWRLRFPLSTFVAMSVVATAFIGLGFTKSYSFLPDPQPTANRNYQTLNVKVLNVAQTQANDNYVPYRQAQFFINRSDPAKDSFISEWGVHFFQRTPLMGAVTANFFNVLGDRPPVDYSWSATSQDLDNTYAKFQIIAHVLNMLFVIPAFFLITKLLNRITAIITCLFFVTSQFFVYNAVFSWPKSLVAFFILLSWLLILEKKLSYTILAGVAGGVAYLSHDLAVLYIAGTAVYLLFNKRFKDLFIVGSLASIIALPWVLISSLFYNRPSSFIYYPLSLDGIPQPQESHKIIDKFFDTSPLTILLIKLKNFFYLMSPFQLLTSEGGQPLFRRLWALGLFSIPGSLGLGLVLPALGGIIQNFRRYSLMIFALVPILVSLLVIGWPKGLGSLHFAEASVVLLSGLAVYFLLGLRSKVWLLLAYLINCIQFTFFLLYSYGFAVSSWLSIGNIASLLVLSVGLLVPGYLIYVTAYTKPSKIAKMIGI